MNSNTLSSNRDDVKLTCFIIKLVETLDSSGSNPHNPFNSTLRFALTASLLEA